MAAAALPRPAWHDRLSLSFPLVFLVGAPCLFITRDVFWHYYPSHFVNDSPSISETASRWPSSQIFEWPMLFVTLCIFVSWSLNLLRNGRRLRDANIRAPLQEALNWGACITGMFAGLCLATIAIYNLHDGHDVHMAGSWAFYISQVLAITLDIIFVMRKPRLLGLPAHQGLATRVAVAAGVLIGSLFFLYMYLSKGSVAPDHKLLVQQIYVASEYTVCLLCLFYPSIVYGEMRRDYREFAIADWQP